MSISQNPVFYKSLLFLERINLLSPKRISKIKYFLRFGRIANLKHPQNLNEKILWLSHDTDTLRWTELSDKYRIREYVTNCGLESLLVKLYGVYGSADDIDFDILPHSFVLKTNNGCGTVMLVEDKSKLDIIQTRKVLNRWLKIPFGILSAEPHYRKIKSCIIAEEYLKEKSSISTSLIDYKVWCFNGKPYYVFIVCNRNIQEHKADYVIYDAKYWSDCRELLSKQYRNNISVPKPKNLDKMLEYATVLSKGFPQVRVDFYEVNGKIYFGEMTFTSQGGLMPYFTQESLRMMGEKITLPRV